MRKPAFMQRESLTRFGIAFLLASGIALPMLLALELERYVFSSLCIAVGMLAFFTVLTTSRKTFILLWVLLGVAAAVQFVLPNAGLFGDWLEAFKAMALYFSGYTIALPLFGAQVASFMVVLITALSFIFAKRGVGFLPAALVVVVTLFGLWSLGKGNLFWYVAPALVALLLQMSQEAHEKINLLHVIPMALAAVLLAFVLTPANRLTLTPLESAATKLKQTITDYLFFTEPRDVFTLGNYGYYPIGNNQLGGAVEPSEFPVMTVKTDRKTLLRAVAKDYYDGRSFSDTSDAKRYLYINPRWQVQRRKAFLELMPSESIRKMSSLMDTKAISVQMQNAAASTVFTPLFLRSLNTTDDMVAYFNEASELFITRDLTAGDKYTVYAPVFEGGDAGLEALVNAPQKDDAYYADISGQYTQLPDHMEQKVFDDVKNIVQNESTAYGKAMAIMRHLQKYYRYTLTPEEPPQNLDFVTYFLYVGKEGYCTYFASAMTVMCRMAGLPTRYVEGFLAQPGADGFAYVTGKEAHAWTEIYFEGFGWVPFDPTPQQNNGSEKPDENQGPSEATPSPSPSPSPAPSNEPNTETPTPEPGQSPQQSTPEPSDPPQDQTDKDPDADAQDDVPNPFPWLWLLAAAAVAALGARITLRMPEQVAKRQANERDRILVYASAVRQLLAFGKRAPKNGETPLLFARRIDGVQAFPTPITPLWQSLALSHYSRFEPTPELTRRAHEVFRKGYRGSSLFRRLRFLLAAAFRPRFYRVLETPVAHDHPPQKLVFHTPKASAPAGKDAHTSMRRPPEKQAKQPPPKNGAPKSHMENTAPPNTPVAGKNTLPDTDTSPDGSSLPPPQGRKRRAP